MAFYHVGPSLLEVDLCLVGLLLGAGSYVAHRPTSIQIVQNGSVPKRHKLDQFGKLFAQNFSITFQMVEQSSRGLLILGEITAVVASSRFRRLHKNLRVLN